jgi:hypothetical protein
VSGSVTLGSLNRQANGFLSVRIRPLCILASHLLKVFKEKLLLGLIAVTNLIIDYLQGGDIVLESES